MIKHALVLLLAAACSRPADTATDDAGADVSSDASLDALQAHGLPIRHAADPVRAARGAQFLEQQWPGRPLLPAIAFDYLWLVWGTGPVDETTRWSEVERRYGMFREPGEPWPVGVQPVTAQSLTFDCRLCHATRGANGETWLGVGNPRLDLARFYRDLVALRAIAQSQGLGTIDIPIDLAGMNGAPGALDAVGLGMRFARTSDALGATFGYQQAPAWWTLRYKDRLYTDGAGRVDNWRTMMSTLFAFGLTQAQIMSHDDEFQDLRHYLLSTEPPAWPYAAPAQARVDAGHAVFAAHCASCHGTYEGAGAAYPELVVDTATIGTDPVREHGMDSAQVGAINASWYGQPAAWTATDGYLAPPLVGVWATAPYFHNGSVPDLLGVLDSSQRPAAWWHASDRHYDPERVGWAFTTSGDAAARYDTTAAGLANTGHTFGDELVPAERTALLDYLKTL